MAKEETKVEAKAEVVVSTGPSKAEYTKIIEAYKKSNPVKYLLKKAELEAKLAKAR